MHHFLRSLSTTQQVGLLFLLMLVVLLCISLTVIWTEYRLHQKNENALLSDELLYASKRSRSLLRSTWLWAVLFWIVWLAGNTTTIVVGALLSLFALREFVSLTPTRRSDHKALIVAFFVVLPIQYILLSVGNVSWFAIFIPVYVFFALPVIAALGNDVTLFSQRSALLQWGIMVCVYGLSHFPALLLLPFKPNDRNVFILLFFFAVVEVALASHFALSRFRNAKPSLPAISSSFNWLNALIAIMISGITGLLLSVTTPFRLGHGFSLAVLASSAGIMGHLVMKALKREYKILHWGGHKNLSPLTGATGLLDRIDALCFAAPVFFYTVRWYFDL